MPKGDDYKIELKTEILLALAFNEDKNLVLTPEILEDFLMFLKFNLKGYFKSDLDFETIRKVCSLYEESFVLSENKNDLGEPSTGMNYNMKIIAGKHRIDIENFLHRFKIDEHFMSYNGSTWDFYDVGKDLIRLSHIYFTAVCSNKFRDIKMKIS